MVDQFTQDEARIARFLEECQKRYTSGDYAGALREAETVLMLDEENATAQVMAAAALVRLGRLSEAEEAARIAADRTPESALARIILGEALLGMGRRDEAESNFWEAVALEPFNPDTHLSLGRFLLLSDRPAEARERLERAAELAPERAEATLLLSHAYGQMDDLANAEAMIEKAYQIAPADDRVLTYRGTLALMRAHEKLSRALGRRNMPAAVDALKRAIGMLRHATEINPRNTFAGEALKSAEDALRHIERTSRKPPASGVSRLGPIKLAILFIVLGCIDVLSDGKWELMALLAGPVTVACLLWLAGREGLRYWRKARRRQRSEQAQSAAVIEDGAPLPTEKRVVEKPPERRAANDRPRIH